jgi:predicted heme/steroid binding protein
MRCQFSGKNSDDGYISLDGRVVPMNDTFRYLKSMLQSEGEIDKDVSHKIRAG